MLMLGTGAGLFGLTNSNEFQVEQGGPPSVAFLAAGPDATYALTAAGALWLRPAGGGWREAHPRPVAAEAWSLAADPKLPGRLYIGVSPAMLHLSNDGGTSWKACESIRTIPGYDTWTFPPPPHIPHICSIAADPLVPGAVYIGVEEGGVYRSEDEGETWASLNQGLDWDVHTILPAAQPGRLFATTGVGFHRSDDAGRSWRHITAGMDRRYTIPLVASGSDGSRVLTAAAATPPPGWRANGTANAAIFASADAGEHWTQAAEGLPARFDSMVRWLLSDAGRIFAISGKDVYTCLEGDFRWTALQTPNAGLTAAEVIPSPPA